MPVIGYKSENLAAFYSKDSGLKLDVALDEKEIALAIHIKRQMNLKGGVLVSNPIPDQYSIDNDFINKYIDEAINKAKQQNIKGKDTTPFLLKAIADATKGKSLDANIALVYNNALVGSLIAKEYNKIK